ncbi:MAG: TetR/AcrR family transcriptional regulator [Pseudomonadota bacterium]
MSAPTKRKYESARQLARQAGILESTRAMLAEVGYSSTTIRGLADRAGVAPGTLYNLYNSKDELVLAAVEDLLVDIGLRANATSGAGLERILSLADNVATVVVENPQYAEAMARALFRVEADDPLSGLLYARSLDFFADHVERGITQGEFLPGTKAHVIAKHLVAQGWGIMLAWIMGTITLDDLYAEYMRSHRMVLLGAVTPEFRPRLEADLALHDAKIPGASDA